MQNVIQNVIKQEGFYRVGKKDKQLADEELFNKSSSNSTRKNNPLESIEENVESSRIDDIAPNQSEENIVED